MAAAAQELQHHLAGGGCSRAPPGQRALQPEQPVEPVAVGGIENGLRHHVLQYLLVLQQEDPVVEQQRPAEILEVDGVRSFLATIRQDPYVLGVVDSVLAVAAESRFYDTAGKAVGVERSDDNTSELQSLMRISYAVLCLKKKTT